MKYTNLFTVLSGLTLTFSLLAFVACQKNDSPVSPTTTGSTSTTTTTGTTVPDVYKKIYGATDIYVEGTNIVIKSNGRPDHKSPYYKGTQWESTLYVNDTRAGFAPNPSKIAAQNYTLKIPMNPASATTKSETPLGVIGIALNGVPFFNQYAAGRATLGMEIVGFDLYGGHPAQSDNYHYHVEPSYLTGQKGKDALLGFLLDGFPVYGPLENGKTLTSADLDTYHGHSHATTEYPKGIYHYHFTADSPYLNGSGFYGTQGTITQ